MSTTGSPATGNRFTMPPGRAIRIVVAGFGVLAGLAAIEHGVGEILQGPVRPDRLIIQSWPEQAVFEPLGGEPALIVIPNLLISGGAAVLVATALAAWTVAGVHRRHGPSILAVLSLVLLCVGGGFGPPLIGLILALGAIPVAVPGHRPGTVARSLAKVWTWALAAGIVAYLGLVPGTLVAHALRVPPSAAVVYGLMVMAFAGLIMALVSARAHDRLRVWLTGRRGDASSSTSVNIPDSRPPRQ